MELERATVSHFLPIDARSSAAEDFLGSVLVTGIFADKLFYC